MKHKMFSLASALEEVPPAYGWQIRYGDLITPGDTLCMATVWRLGRGRHPEEPYEQFSANGKTPEESIKLAIAKITQ